MDTNTFNIIFLTLLVGLYVAIASWYHLHKQRLTLEIVLEYTVLAAIVWFIALSII